MNHLSNFKQFHVYNFNNYNFVDRRLPSVYKTVVSYIYTFPKSDKQEVNADRRDYNL